MEAHGWIAWGDFSGGGMGFGDNTDFVATGVTTADSGCFNSIKKALVYIAVMSRILI